MPMLDPPTLVPPPVSGITKLAALAGTAKEIATAAAIQAVDFIKFPEL